MESKTYPDRESWLASRPNTIGASDVATICGVNPYKSAYTLWAEKTGALPSGFASLPARVGLALEDLVTELYEEETGLSTIDPGDYTVFTHPDYPFWTCTPDRLVYLFGIINRAVELKTIGENAARGIKKGETPLAYQVQLQAQLAVLGADRGDLACLIGNRSFDAFPYDRHDKLIKAITIKVKEFHDRILNNDAPPVDGTKSTALTLATLHPDDNGKVIVFMPDVLDAAERLEQYKIRAKELDVLRREAENAIKQAIGDATFANCEDSHISLKTQTRSGYLKVDANKKDALLDAGIEFKETKGSKFRTLRTHKGVKS